MKIKFYLVIAFLLLMTLDGIGQNITRGPYLQMNTPSSIIIRWRTNSSTESKVWYGNSPTNLSLTSSLSGSRTEHEIQITGLPPNTIYYYAVGNNAGPIAGADDNHFFKTSPIAGTVQPVSIWVLGDAGKNRPGETEQRAVRDAFYEFNGGPHVDLILALGDNAYEDGSDSDFQTGWFENMYEPSLINSAVWPTIGNHDLHEADSDSESGPYYDIFNLPRNGEAGGEPSGTEAYYSYDYANIHFVCLNSEDVDLGSSGAMYSWLQQDLANNSQKWLVAYFHRQPYYDSAPMRTIFVPVLEAAGVDLIMFGHKHAYQRSPLINEHYGGESSYNVNTMAINPGDGKVDGDGAYEKPLDPTPNAGTVYLQSGSAGSGGSPLNLEVMPFMVSGAEGVGSVHIGVNGPQMEVTYISLEGNILDYFSIHKQVGTTPSVIVTNPINGTTYATPQTINLTADASDPDGQVSQVEFFVDGASVGMDDSNPYSVSWTPPVENFYEIYAVVIDNDGNMTTSSAVTVRMGIPLNGSVEVQVSSVNDDAEENIDTKSVGLTSSDLELGYELTVRQLVGVRFTNVDLQPGSNITNAYLQFTLDEVSSGTSELLIMGQNADNAAIFTNSSGNISSRPRTTTSAMWNPASWDNGETNGPDQRTVDVSHIVQEIINRPGWSANNAMAFLLSGTGTRTADSYDGNPAGAAVLIVEFDNTPVNCPTAGNSCDDGDACTENDTLDANCNCVGTFMDSDGDGVCDADDICDGDDTVDSDGDLIPDDCDPCPNSATGDSDGDGVCDDADLCPAGDDTVDTDMDGVPDACDICVGDDTVDTDGDLIPDDCDLCPNSATGDSDGDGVCDDVDLCPGSDDNGLDTDMDGTPDACDPCDNSLIGTICDDGDANTTNDMIGADCQCTGTPTTPNILNVSVTSSSDDVEERPGGSLSFTSSDLELVDDTGGNQVVGIRFNNISIPAGASIQGAYVQFTTDEVFSGAVSLFVEGEAIDNAPAFSTAGYNVSSRSRTAAPVSWDPPAWNNTGEAGVNQRTADISSIIQEIVTRPGWVNGNSIVIIITGTGKRTAVSYDKSAAQGPALHVEYFDSSCNLTGTSCNDGDPCTTGDVYDSFCNCLGTFQDSDGDGVCDADDICVGDDTVDTDGDTIPDSCDPCDNSLDGLTCDDNNSSTFDDVWDDNCNCAGTPCPTAGTACNDSDPSTENDVEDGNCNCAGTPCPTAGTDCDDGDSSTYNDIEDGNCNCAGTPCEATGTSCDDGNLSTFDDVWDDNCNCAGTPCPPAGTSCDDGNLSTENDVEDGNCNCVGTPCPPAGTACNDGDPSTKNDVEDGNCNCAGTPCPVAGTACDDGNLSTDNDVEDGNCNCAGTPCPVAGAACDDGNLSTDNDVEDGNCNCAGTPCPAAGTACDDGNPNTINDVVGANCNCAGTPSTPSIVDVTVSNGSDDVEQRENDGSIYVTSSDLELVNDGGRGNQTIGIRFNNVSVPAGASIQHAYVQFTVDRASSGDAILLVEGEATDQATPFASTAYDVSNRIRTSAKVNWNPLLWATVGARGEEQRTANLSAIIQEIVSRPGWVDGNSIVIIITGTGQRRAISYEGNAAQGAGLHIEYFEITCDLTGTGCDDGDPCTIGDVYDAFCNCTGVLQDSDGDGVCDTEDICDGDDTIDTDGDSIPNDCDICPNSATGDTDGDGVCDDLDQCPGFDDRLIGSTCDDGDENTLNDVIGTDCTCAGFPDAPTILEVQVSQGDDDVEQRESDGSIYTTSSDLELVNDGARGNQTIGIRFNNVTIPPGASIHDAYVQFTVDETIAQTASLLIEGEASDNALPFVRAAYNVSNRARTNTSVAWNPPAWNMIGDATTDQRTADISSIIEEIVRRPGWVSGSSITLIITGTGKRTAMSYDKSAADGPALYIEYSHNNTANVAGGLFNLNVPNAEPEITPQTPASFDGSQEKTVLSSGNIAINDLRVTVKPNPFRDAFSLFISRPYLETIETNQASIRIIDINGKVIYQQLDVPLEQDHLVIPQHGWPDGLYFVRVQAGAYLHTLRVIKQ